MKIYQNPATATPKRAKQKRGGPSRHKLDPSNPTSMEKQESSPRSEELIALVGAKKYEAVYKWLLEHSFPFIRRYVNTNGGSDEDAKDVFHDTFLAFIEKVGEEKFSWKGDLAKLSNVIGKYRWLKILRAQPKKGVFDEALSKLDPGLGIDELLEKQEKNQLIASCLKALSLKERVSLMLFYYYSLSHSDIAILLDFESARVSTAMKNTYMNKLKNLVSKKMKKQ